MSTRPGLHSSKLHRIDWRLAREDAGDVARAFGLQLLERLNRVERGMRCQYHIVAAEERRILWQRLGRHHVERGAAEATSAASSISGPRAVLMISAPIFILAKTSALTRPRVTGVSGACTETKSERA